MNRVRTIFVAALTTAFMWTGAAHAVPVQSFAGRSSITFFERTTSLFTLTFGAASLAMLQRIPGTMTFPSNTRFLRYQ